MLRNAIILSLAAWVLLFALYYGAACLIKKQVGGYIGQRVNLSNSILTNGK